MNKKEKFIGTRRKFLKSAGLWSMACGLNVEHAIAASGEETEFKVLSENRRFDIGDSGKDIIQKAYDLGYLFEDKY